MYAGYPLTCPGFSYLGVHLSVVSGFTFPGVQSSGVQLSGVQLSGVSLVRGSSAITFWFGSAIPRVRHFQGAPLDSMSEHFAPRTVTHRYTTQQVSNAIHFTAGQHRYHSAFLKFNHYFHKISVSLRNKPIRHPSFWDPSDQNTRLLRPGLVESTCCVHVRRESGQWLL